MGGVPLIDANRELIGREQECAVRGLRDRAPWGSAAVLDARRVPVTVPFRTQHPLGGVVNRPSVWSDR